MGGKDKNKGVKKSVLGRALASNITTLASSNERSSFNTETSKTKSILERSNIDEYISNLMVSKDLNESKIFIQPQHKEFSIDRQFSKRSTYPIVPIPKRPIIYHRTSKTRYNENDYTSESSLTSSVQSNRDIPDIPTDSELIDDRDDSYPSMSDYEETVSDKIESEISSSTEYESSIPVMDKTPSFDTTQTFDYIKDTNIDDIHIIKYCVELKNRIKTLRSNYDLPQLTGKQLDEIELEGFYEWRRILSKIEEMENLVMTPYEKNIEYWRQLWRVVERSHLICIIIDARDPLFYRTPDLEYYIKQVDTRKDILLILNKSDFLSKKQRFLWSNYLKKLNIKFVFFSALRELYSQSIIKLDSQNEIIFDENNFYPAYGNLSYDEDNYEFNIMSVRQLLDYFIEKKEELSCLYESDEWILESGIPQFVVGFIGYPNVGKSSIINSILGAKKVSVSEQPGKTKHFQTIQIGIPGVTLCDCPGLIFPSIVSTKYHLLTNGIASIHQFRGKLMPAVQIICDLIPIQLCKKFNIPLNQVLSQFCKSENKPASRCRVNATLLLEKLCELRKFTSSGKGGQYDLNRASKLILSNYISGHLLYSHYPPDSNESTECQICLEVINEAPIDDFDEWLNTENKPISELTMTKRKMRFLRKNMFKSNSKTVKNISNY